MDLFWVGALCGDNCTTNWSFAKIVGWPSIGCASHCYNLAVQVLIKADEDIFAQVHAVMVKLSNIIPSAKLREQTHIKQKVNNATRWAQCFTCWNVINNFWPFLRLLELDDINEMLPKPSVNKNIESTFEILGELDSVTAALRSHDLTLAEGRSYFDTVVE